MDVVEILESLHDGHLLAISLQSPTVLRLKCRPLKGASVVIEIGGIRDLWAGNFRTGNIILCAEIRGSIDQLDSLSIRGLANSGAEEHIAAYTRLMREREATGLIRYLAIQSSYGCDLAVVYEGDLNIVDNL